MTSRQATEVCVCGIVRHLVHTTNEQLKWHNKWAREERRNEEANEAEAEAARGAKTGSKGRNRGRDKSREREVQGQLSALLGESRSRVNDDVCHFDSCKSNTKQGFMPRSRQKKSR